MTVKIIKTSDSITLKKPQVQTGDILYINGKITVIKNMKQKEKDPHAQAMAKKSWEKRQKTQGSEYFRELAKKSHAKRKKNKKLSTVLKKKIVA